MDFRAGGVLSLVSCTIIVGVFDIFVSYRKKDALFGVATVHDRLTRRFGDDRVFFDDLAIEPGAEYPDQIDAALNEVCVLVVLIGPNWLVDPTGVRLLDREGDWVRREIRHALQRRIPIIPVLLDGVLLPSSDELPSDVRLLTRRQVVECRPRTLRADLDRLEASIARWVPEEPPMTAERRTRWWRVGVVLLVIALLFVDGDSPRPQADAGPVIGDLRAADPCALIEASPFVPYGEAKLDRVYGAFQRCDLLISRNGEEPVDVEVRFDEDPLPEAPSLLAGKERSGLWCGRGKARRANVCLRCHPVTVV